MLSSKLQMVLCCPHCSCGEIFVTNTKKCYFRQMRSVKWPNYLPRLKPLFGDSWKFNKYNFILFLEIIIHFAGIVLRFINILTVLSVLLSISYIFFRIPQDLSTVILLENEKDCPSRPSDGNVDQVRNWNQHSTISILKCFTIK